MKQRVLYQIILNLSRVVLFFILEYNKIENACCARDARFAWSLKSTFGSLTADNGVECPSQKGNPEVIGGFPTYG